jgi:hypothetical protein
MESELDFPRSDPVLFNHPYQKSLMKTKPEIRNQNFEVDSVR